MKKKFGLIAFVAVCTIALTISIASFTLGMSGSSAKTSAADGALSDIYDSYLTQVQHIIDNSNLGGDYDSEITHYHIVQIVDSESVVDSANNKLSEYITRYISNDSDEQSLKSGNFRTEVIGSDMKAKYIDVKTYVANDPELATAIKGADFIYIACNDNYSGSNDLTASALDALENYAISEFKPVLIDSDVVGVTDRDISVDTSHSTLIYDYLKLLSNTVNGSDSINKGYASVKEPNVSWSDYFDPTNKDSAYITFNNKGNMSWNTFDYDTYKHKVLEIVPNDATRTVNADGSAVTDSTGSNKMTALQECIEDGTFEEAAFYTPVKKENIEYVQMTAEEFNAYVESQNAAGVSNKKAIFDYDFVYINHESDDKIYYYETTDYHTKYDFSENAIVALKGFCSKTSADRDSSISATDAVAVNRFMIDGNFFNVYKYSNSSSSNGKVDTSTNMYKIATQLISPDASSKYVKNVEISSSGYFGDMTGEKANAVTALINRSTYRTFSAGNGASFKVLEIEPYYTVTNTSWYSTKQDDLTNTLENATYQEIYEVENTMYNAAALSSDTPYYSFTLTQAKIAAATGLMPNQISVSTLSANALSATTSNLLEDYDLVYIGGKNDSVKDTSQWNVDKILTSSKNSNSKSAAITFLSFSPDDINNFYFQATTSTPYSSLQNNSYVYPTYAHTGEFAMITDQRNAFTVFNGSDYVQGGVVRTNGTDITAKIYGQLYSYIAAGMPVIFEAEMLDSDYLIGGASENANLVEDETRTIKVSDTVSFKRLTLDTSVNDNAKLTFKNKSGSMSTITYKETTYSDETMTARRESCVDPESYMYQLMYKIAEDKDSGIYHADNVMVGFDSTDLTTNANIYRKGITADTDETVPDDIETGEYTDTASLISELDADKYSSYKSFNIFNNEVVKTITGAVNYSKSGSGVQLKHFLNEHAATRPVINLISAPKNYDSDLDMDKSTRRVNDKSPTYSFSVSGVTGETYTVKLYYDFDGDGKFSDDETEGRLEGSTYEDEVVAQMSYKVGTDGIIVFNESSEYTESDFVIDDDFVGVMPYKIVVSDSKGKCSSVSGYPKYYSNSDEDKQTIRLLQIIPGGPTGSLGSISQKVTTLCVKENTLGNGSNLGSACNGKHVFGITSATDTSDNLASRLSDEYNIELEIMTTGQLSEVASLYILDYCKNFEEYQVDDNLSKEDITAFTKFMNNYYNSSSKKMNSDWESLISMNNTTIIDFEQIGIPDSIFRSWFTSGDVNKSITMNTKSYNGKEQTFDLGYYDMVVLGFAKEMGHNVYEWADMSNVACQFVRAYTENNGSVLLGADTLSFNGFFNTSTMKWSRNINQYLRSCFGMDRFKFTESSLYTSGSNTSDFYSYINDGNSFDGGGTQYLFTPYSTDSYNELMASKLGSSETDTGQTFPGEFFTTNSYNGTYENDTNTNYKMSGGGSTDAVAYALSNENPVFKDVTVANIGQGTDILTTSRVARNNVGLMTSYPFSISAYPNISRTNAQSFALDTEDNDMSVWYTLAGASDSSDSSLFAADPLNGRSFYYIYSYKSVTYTGAGYSAIADAVNNNDERELIINTILNRVKIHRAGPSVVFSKFSGETDSEFTSATATEDAILKCAAQNKKHCDFNFTVTTSASRTLSDVKMFIDADEDGVYNEDAGDIIIKDYDATDDFKLEVSVEGDDLPEEITTYLQSGAFYITVSATDSDGKNGNARLLVKTESKLYNLN